MKAIAHNKIAVVVRMEGILQLYPAVTGVEMISNASMRSLQRAYNQIITHAWIVLPPGPQDGEGRAKCQS